MHVQVSRVRRNGRTYEYARLVESFRKPNGIPALRVIANLGSLDAVALENLKTTLRASRAGKRVHAEREIAGAQALKPAQNLRFLDLAVLLELSQSFGLTDVLHDVLPRGEADVSPGDVVLALALQRCVDAGSKLYAERWFPRSALPELLRIAPHQFHNTRLHRVLDSLDDATDVLMRKLPLLYEKHGAAASAMFLDCTDTRFVGRGPELAEVAKTKEGLFERKVGILLLCNERGLPLQWKVISGKTAEPAAMVPMLEAIRGLSWVGSAPIVIDRIMGASAEVRKLLAMGVRFITAARTNEFASYGPKMPHDVLKDLHCAADASDEDIAACAHEAARRIEAAGLLEVAPTQWVQDLGVVERDASVSPVDDQDHGGTINGVRALDLARQIKRQVDDGASDSLRGAGRTLGLTSAMTKKYLKLLRLEPNLQDDLLAGKFSGVSIARLMKVASLSGAQAQRATLTSLRVTRAPALSRPASSDVELATTEKAARIRVRAVMSFNPERFANERSTSQTLLLRMQEAVLALNEELAGPRSRRTRKQVERAVDRLLERKKVVELYEVHIDEKEDTDRGCKRYQVRLELNPVPWARRFRHHGFAIFLVHPEVTESAAEVAQLYRAKDRVEKDFQTIKSLIKLRPVWHRTDKKVRAHVTVCILALLLERLLDRCLPADSPSGGALESLATCQLNRFNGHRASHYLVTEPDKDQRALLRALRLEHLVDDDALATQIQPRPASL